MRCTKGFRVQLGGAAFGVGKKLLMAWRFRVKGFGIRGLRAGGFFQG